MPPPSTGTGQRTRAGQRSDGTGRAQKLSTRSRRSVRILTRRGSSRYASCDVFGSGGSLTDIFGYFSGRAVLLIHRGGDRRGEPVDLSMTAVMAPTLSTARLVADCTSCDLERRYPRWPLRFG